jgi:hypothetical protein
MHVKVVAGAINFHLLYLETTQSWTADLIVSHQPELLDVGLHQANKSRP